jgi:dTDP-4-dehydrorhamnose 3,5-epimerase
MKVLTSSLDGVCIIEPAVYADARGFFTETYNRERYRAAGFGQPFVQDNLSFSVRGTIRGLHYQHPHDQAKLVMAVKGQIYDVAVDIRRGSPRFGQWVGVRLSEDNKRQIFIPEGFAHGFCVLSETAIMTYKCTDFYHPGSEKGIIWSDPDLGIDWPVRDPLISDKDRRYGCLKDLLAESLPAFQEAK